jgi:multidrug transporter EmrE-like cation transporter
MYIASILIAILGLIVYQLSMKTAPRSVNPFWLLGLAYLMAAVMCVGSALAWTRYTPAEGTLPLTRTNVLACGTIAISVLLIEIGYLLVYRSGWSISVAPAISQAVVLSVVFALGIVFFGETLTAKKVMGLFCCIGGIALLVQK